MRWLLVGVLGVALAGCSKQEPGGAAGGAPGLAFQYGYTFRLPSDRIAAAQEQDAARCERLALPRCRITGMAFTVDGAGEVNASLAVAVGAPLARGFGRDGVAAIEKAGGALIGANISGTNATAEAASSERGSGHARSEVARIDAQLARGDLSGAERAELTRQRAAAAGKAQARADASTTAWDSVATTPVFFAYRAGHGVGAAATLAEAGGTAYASLLTTLSLFLSALAVLGPPVLLLLALSVLWWRFGRPAWARLFPA